MSMVMAAVLADNHTLRPPLLAEHGLAVLIQTPSRVALFDTGCSRLFARNAAQMNFELYGVSDIIVSHGHHDHTGGIDRAMFEAPNAVLRLHPDAMRPKYHHDTNGRMRPNGIPETSQHAISRAEQEGRLRLVNTPSLKLDGSMIVIASGGRHTLPSDWRFFTADEAGAIDLDHFAGELSLLVTGDHSSLLVVGCAHSGITAIVEEAEHHAEKPIRAILGGSHIDASSDTELDAIAAFFAARPLIDLYLGHCTGIGGFSRLYQRLPARLNPIGVGTVIELDF